MTMTKMKRNLGWVAVICAEMPVASASAQLLLRYERPPVPPADIPNAARSYPGSGKYNAYGRRLAPPLPRTRPGDLTTGVAREVGQPPRSDAQRAVAPSRTGAAPPEISAPATSRPAAPTMVPVAPLE